MFCKYLTAQSFRLFFFSFAGVCPRLNNMASNPNIITIENFKLLRLSTYNRTVGAVVEVSCLKPLKLYGSPIVTCQKNFSWTNQPKCDCKFVV